MTTRFRVNRRSDRQRVAMLGGDVTIATTAGVVTGLTVDLEPGTYYVEANVVVVPGSATGIITALNGTATVTTGTALTYVRTIAAGDRSAAAVATTLAAAASPSTVIGILHEHRGTLVCTVAGTVNVSGIGAAANSTAKAGSFLKVTRID